MRLIKIAELARLGIPRRTINRWVLCDRSIAIWIPRKGREKESHTPGNGEYMIRLDKLAGRPGIDLVEALTIGSGGRWMKISELLEASNHAVSRWTLTRWCRTRPGFGKRIGRLWYVDLEQLGASDMDVEKLFSNLGQPSPHKEEQS